jgi:hypothetical protein
MISRAIQILYKTCMTDIIISPTEGQAIYRTFALVRLRPNFEPLSLFEFFAFQKSKNIAP